MKMRRNEVRGCDTSNQDDSSPTRYHSPPSLVTSGYGAYSRSDKVSLVVTYCEARDLEFDSYAS